MKAAMALLADYATQNIARRLVFKMSQAAEFEFFGSLLPSHVSLKQPFVFEDMPRLEAWFDSFAARTTPFDVTLNSVYYSTWEGYGILGFEVVETPVLRNLHKQINRELVEVVANASAPHDGDEYRFHMTVELGPIRQANPFKAFYDSLADKTVNLTFHARNLALFIYADRPIQSGSFILYRVMPFAHLEL